ncbi:MAG: c-type cytochrome, partial [Geobacter sp.]|nr:c-type cytochrome [Geobacter sp.]
GNGKALNSAEVQGLKLFMDKGCAACHGGINLGGGGYFPFGVAKAPDADLRPVGDLGRFKVTNTESDRFSFKSPSLRNINLTPPYFHSGKVWTLGEAVSVMASSQLGTSMTPAETAQVVSFLKSLTGKQPAVEYPILPPNADATPKPMVQ